jgi:hypothetical protein
VLAPVHGGDAQVEFRARGALDVAEFGEHRECLGALGRGRVEVTFQPRGEAERVAGAGHALAVAERLVLGQALRVQFPCPGVPPLLPGRVPGASSPAGGAVSSGPGAVPGPPGMAWFGSMEEILASGLGCLRTGSHPAGAARRAGARPACGVLVTI